MATGYLPVRGEGDMREVALLEMALERLELPLRRAVGSQLPRLNALVGQEAGNDQRSILAQVEGGLEELEGTREKLE